MKTIFSTLLSAIMMVLYSSTLAQTASEIISNPNAIKDTSKKSINAAAIGIVEGDTIKISYHSPGVRKRIIWGGLVPYDEVWVTGAHNATTLEINKSFVIGDRDIEAGTYSLFSIPGRKEWIVIIKMHFRPIMLFTMHWIPISVKIRNLLIMMVSIKYTRFIGF